MVDFIAQGMAASAAATAAQRSRVLMSMARSGPVSAPSSGGSYLLLASVLIPANTIQGGETIDIQGMLEKYFIAQAGTNISVRIGNLAGTQYVQIGQAYLNASIMHYPIKQSLHISPDRKSAMAATVNLFNTVSPTYSSVLNQFNASASPASGIGARAPSSSIMFVSYSASPTVETVIVDFTQNQYLQVWVQPQNSDVIELVGFKATIEAPGATPLNFANPHAIIIPGDSLTEGTGATSNFDWASQLRKLMPGYPVDPRGLGGQITAQIVARAMQDNVNGKFWNMIIWAGTNDIQTTGAAWWSAMYPYLDQLIAWRPGPNLRIVNLHPRAGWATSSAYYIATQYVNTQLASRYSGQIIDVFTALATASGQVPINLYNTTATTTGTIANGSNTLTVASAAGLVVGQYVISPGSSAIDTGANGTSPVISAISGTTITLQTATGGVFSTSAALSGAAVSFIGAGEVHLNNNGYAIVANAAASAVTSAGW